MPITVITPGAFRLCKTQKRQLPRNCDAECLIVEAEENTVLGGGEIAVIISNKGKTMSLIALIKCHPRRIKASALRGLCDRNEGLLVAVKKTLQLCAVSLIIQVKNSQQMAAQG